jgi:hypothetical protein
VYGALFFPNDVHGDSDTDNLKMKLKHSIRNPLEKLYKHDNSEVLKVVGSIAPDRTLAANFKTWLEECEG